MEVKRVTKKLRISSYDAVRYQLMTELMFFKKENIIPSDMELMTLLALWGKIDLRSFCVHAAKTIYKDLDMESVNSREQNVRNRIVKLSRRGLVIKTKGEKNFIELNPEIEVYTKGNILLDYNLLALEPDKTK